MPDRNDDVDSWLSGRIEPLPPPPGTFELIKRRARHRKYRRLAITAGAAAIIVAAGVAVPQVVRLSPLGPVNNSGRSGAVPSPVVTATGGGVPQSSSSARPTLAPPPVPPSFQPTSVTFVSTGIGWVIGQAGTPGHCATQYCTSVARTDNAGNTWFGVPAPLTGAPDGATGVGGIRFLNGEDGWAFGPQLFATHDGGHTWAQVDTDGLRVTDLETVGDRAFAVFASCTGSGADFAAQCTKFTLYSSPAGTDDWTPVGASTSGLSSEAAGLRFRVDRAHREPGVPAGSRRGAVGRTGGRQRGLVCGGPRPVRGRHGPAGRPAVGRAARRDRRYQPAPRLHAARRVRRAPSRS